MTESNSPATTPAIREILVPLDGSRLAEVTIPYVETIAREFDAGVILLHILEHDAPQTVHGEPHLLDEASSNSYLGAWAERLSARGIRVESHVHENRQRDVSGSLVEHADEMDADLIVLATHGSGGVRGFLHGRVAQQVLRRGTRPVLMVHAPVDPSTISDVQFRVIAVPLNGEVEAESALPLALAMALESRAQILLIRIVPTVATLGADRAATAILIPGTARAVLDLEAEDAERYLARIAVDLRRAGAATETSIVRGDPATTTVSEIDRSGADLLVMATHGRQGLSGIWAGSVGSKILAKYTGPVLLVRPR